MFYSFIQVLLDFVPETKKVLVQVMPWYWTDGKPLPEAMMNQFNDKYVMKSSNGNIFCITSPLWAEFSGHRWIPLIKASDTELWYFLWSAPEQMVEQTIEMMVIWDTIMSIMTSL